MFKRYWYRRRTRRIFNRFTEKAQRLMVLAQEEATRFNHDHIGTYHVLLGFLSQGQGLTASILRRYGVTLDDSREWIENSVGYGENRIRHGEERRRDAQLPLTPRLIRALEHAWRESKELGKDRIDAEHVLLGMLREGRGVSESMLIDMGVQPEEVRRDLLR